ncbi:hypothetical protein BC332_28168 [Capsicum chinense]|nr:hypothetical protein BC332_28168 [Capsicum chinense]
MGCLGRISWLRKSGSGTRIVEAEGGRVHSKLCEYDVEDSVVPLQPSLEYTAPELVRSKTYSVGCSSDIFSFGCVAYHLIARKPLLDCHNNVKMRHAVKRRSGLASPFAIGDEALAFYNTALNTHRKPIPR